MLRLFETCVNCEISRDQHGQATARFSIDPLALKVARDFDHPGFNWSNWEAWELLDLMRELARWHNDDVGVQQSYTSKVKPFPRRR